MENISLTFHIENVNVLNPLQNNRRQGACMKEGGPMRNRPKSEQVKIFFSHDARNPEKLEKEVNQWLTEREGGINIVERTVSFDRHDGTSMVITIWYREKE
ncbi:MAG: hypothetical protein A2563_03035 [Candidatus Magasanikbacteria bacterium RIFOXYD1_FULL_40_23]|uniref:Uncharacterized protein n=1 Tax=Candidatus Magasanikbacteria bacterium RIFOXYD1_FULL_40_23 TaxID=1798705 RepID=A0A1F6P9L4_9BACT|nr:MAG: hypothetical protein A2563_03035 [Candidatus Magasanikbacteria bacterium RIFOXYD1_FULL_40_23]